MRYAIIALLFLLPGALEAYVPLVVEPKLVGEIHSIEDPELSQMFYGKLTNFPHTYRIVEEDEFTLHVQIYVPDIEGAENIINGIVLRQLRRGGVEEMSRLFAKDSEWGPYYEPIGGDTYRKGPVYEAELPPGEYLIEMSTPDNLSPYVMEVGVRVGSGGLSYFELLSRIRQVKEFYGKSFFSIVESRLVYGPLILLFIIAIVAFLLRLYMHSKNK